MIAELAIVLRAESCARESRDPRVAECLRVRRAWARGEATDAQRAAAMAACLEAAEAAREPEPSPWEDHVRETLASCAAMAAAATTLRDAVFWAGWFDPREQQGVL